MLSETEILPMVLLYARYDVDSDVKLPDDRPESFPVR
jgi:hypothetical protein